MVLTQWVAYQAPNIINSTPLDEILPQLNAGDREREGMTILMYLASHGYDGAIQKLFSNTLPCDLDAQDESGYTALCWALDGKHDTIAEFLIHKGACLKQALSFFPDHWIQEKNNKVVCTTPLKTI